MNTLLRRTGFVVVAALSLGGCGTHPGPTVATAQRPVLTASGNGSTAASPPTPESDYDKALRFTRCMNDNTKHVDRNGQDMPGSYLPDPVVGKPLVNGTDGAFEKCQQFLPTTWPIKADPSDIARERPFGECMRQHGISYPDPDANGMMNYPTNPMAQETPEYQTAEKACAHLLNDPAVKANQQ